MAIRSESQSERHRRHLISPMKPKGYRIKLVEKRRTKPGNEVMNEKGKGRASSQV